VESSLSSFLDNKNISFLQLTKFGSPKIKPSIKFLCEFSTVKTMHASSLHASLNQTGFNVNIDYLRCDPIFFLWYLHSHVVCGNVFFTILLLLDFSHRISTVTFSPKGAFNKYSGTRTK